MLLDSREIWNMGGYSKDHDFDVSMNRVRKYAKDKNFNGIELLLAEFFIELSDNPSKYYNEDHHCDCKHNCGLTNSGTNAVHELFQRIDNAVEEETITENDIFTKKLNNLILAHISQDNKKYTDLYGPKDKMNWTLWNAIKRMFTGKIY